MTTYSRRNLMTVLGGALCFRPGSAQELRWPSKPPAGCPFPQSSDLKSVVFTGRHAHYTSADTWYPSWASDGNLYSPWTDGAVNGLKCDSNGIGRWEQAATGSATITGDDPMKLVVKDQAIYPGDPRPYEGRYPCGSLVYEGIWYYGTYCLMDTDDGPSKGLNWDILGPFVGFRHSRDFGRTWTDTPHSPAQPLFGEPARKGGPLKLGAPHFVDFGRNMMHSPDGMAYLTGHGAVAGDASPRPANLSWITGDQVYLARVRPGVQTINDPAAYELYAGSANSGEKKWARGIAAARPLLEWNNRMGCVTATYNAGLKRYLMCVTDGGTTVSRFNTYILEARALEGPWRLVAFLENFGEQAYFVNIPSKFISADGRIMWLCYSANFTNGYLKTNFASNPPGSRYGMCLYEIRLQG